MTFAMMRTTRLHLAALPLLAALLAFQPASPALAAPPTLDPVHARLLKAVGMPIVLPAVTPPGVKLAHVVTRAHGGHHGGVSYAAVYEGGGVGFAVESSPGGIGDFPGKPAAWFTAGALKAGKAAIYFEKAGDARAPSLITEWVPFKEHYYRLVGASYTRRHLDDMIEAEREVDAGWAKRIAESLRPVTP